MRTRINISSILEKTVCFLLLLSFGSVLSVFFPYSVELLLLLFTLILMLVNKAYIINLKLLKFVVLTLVVLIASMLLTHSSLYDYKRLFVRVIMIFFVITSFRNKYDDISKSMISALWVIVYLALINFILTLIIPMLFSEVVHETGYRVFTLGYVFNMLVKHSVLGINIVRNQAIFWEPGILQIPVNILIYYILIEKKQSFSKSLLPVFILITTISTTGFIILTFIMFVRFKDNFSLKGKELFHTIGMIFVIMMFVPIVYGEMKHKFSGDAKVSSTMRLFDLYAGLSIAAENPIIGVGLNPQKILELTGNRAIKVDGAIMQAERGNTNSFILMLINLGIPIAIILFFCLYRQNIFRYRFVFFVIIFLSLSSEPLFTSHLFILLAMSSVKLNYPQFQELI